MKQSSGQRFAGKSLGHFPGRRSGPFSEQEAGRRAGWAVQPNFLPGRATGKGLRHTDGLGFRQNKMGFKIGPGSKAIFQKKKVSPIMPAQALSSSFFAEAEGGLNTDVDIHGEVAAETIQSQLQVESQRIESPLADPSNKFEMSMPFVNSPSISFFGRPLFQGGSSGLGVSHALGEEVEGVLPLEIVAANEMKGGSSQEGMMVEYGQEEGIVEATPLAVEGYEKWEDSMLVKFSEFLGFATEGFETQIIELMRQMVKTQNKGPRPGQGPVSRCERELKKLECTINYGGQRSGKSANRDRGNLLLKLG